jgi:hypothetical protein
MTTPEERFQSDERPLRFPKDSKDLDDCFTLTETRRVSRDNVLSVAGIDYEVPRGHAKTLVTVWRRLLRDELFILHDGKTVRLHPVDLAHNATSGRARARPSAPEGDEGSPTTAASLAFAKDFGPVVGADGGLIRPPVTPTDEGDQS